MMIVTVMNGNGSHLSRESLRKTVVPEWENLLQENIKQNVKSILIN